MDLSMEWLRQILLVSSFLHSCSVSRLLAASALGLRGGLLKTVLHRTWGPGEFEGIHQGPVAS